MVVVVTGRVVVVTTVAVGMGPGTPGVTPDPDPLGAAGWVVVEGSGTVVDVAGTGGSDPGGEPPDGGVAGWVVVDADVVVVVVVVGGDGPARSTTDPSTGRVDARGIAPRLVNEADSPTADTTAAAPIAIAGPKGSPKMVRC